LTPDGNNGKDQHILKSPLLPPVVIDTIGMQNQWILECIYGLQINTWNLLKLQP
jgi:hypothetical protein